jgi:hypothetical protein
MTLKNLIERNFNNSNDRFVDLNALAKVLERLQEAGQQYIPGVTRGLDRLTNTFEKSMDEMLTNILRCNELLSKIDKANELVPLSPLPSSFPNSPSSPSYSDQGEAGTPIAIPAVKNGHHPVIVATKAAKPIAIKPAALGIATQATEMIVTIPASLKLVVGDKSAIVDASSALKITITETTKTGADATKNTTDKPAAPITATTITEDANTIADAPSALKSTTIETTKSGADAIKTGAVDSTVPKIVTETYVITIDMTVVPNPAAETNNTVTNASVTTDTVTADANIIADNTAPLNLAATPIAVNIATTYANVTTDIAITLNTAIAAAAGIVETTTEATNQINDGNATTLDGDTIEAGDILNHIEKETDAALEDVEIV